MLTHRKITLFLLLMLSFGFGAYQLLITPNNPLIKWLRPPISATDSKIIIGPYPLEADLRLLRSHQVTMLISLLNPDVPYEATLLEQEREMAKRYGFTLLSFPMGSILGQRFGDDYQKNAELAAQAALNASGKVYLHCYLGLHRVRVVAELLEQKQAGSESYLPRTAERDDDVRRLDTAQAQFDRGDYAAARATLANMKNPDVPAQMLGAWTAYRLDDFEAARETFSRLVQSDPANTDARVGFAYSALRLGNLDEAAGAFESALSIKADDRGALTGMGIVHYRRGALADALTVLRRAVDIDPANDEAKDLLGKVESALKNPATPARSPHKTR